LICGIAVDSLKRNLGKFWV